MTQHTTQERPLTAINRLLGARNHPTAEEFLAIEAGLSEQRIPPFQKTTQAYAVEWTGLILIWTGIGRRKQEESEESETPTDPEKRKKYREARKWIRKNKDATAEQTARIVAINPETHPIAFITEMVDAKVTPTNQQIESVRIVLTIAKAPPFERVLDGRTWEWDGKTLFTYKIDGDEEPK